jgi:hypothetical protein
MADVTVMPSDLIAELRDSETSWPLFRCRALSGSTRTEAATSPIYHAVLV